LSDRKLKPLPPDPVRHQDSAIAPQNGQIDQAREALARLKEMHPDLSIDWIEKNVPYTLGPMAKFVEGMRKAGLQ
jgi:hypothetical protein